MPTSKPSSKANTTSETLSLRLVGEAHASPDFIDSFLDYTQGISSPELFRLWGAIALVAGALERRVWIKNGSRIAFPNLYTLLVAPPGVGKSVIDIVRELWTEATQQGSKIAAFNVAPDSMTKASLIDTLADAKTTFLSTGGSPFIYHSLLIAAEEFSVLLPSYDMEYIGVLNSIWSNKPRHEERRRYGKAQNITIENPTLNLIGGAQPAWLASLFPEDAWGTGLARRLVMIYSTDTPHFSLFHNPDIDEGLHDDLLSQLSLMSSLYGPMHWEFDAMSALDEWYMSGEPNLGGAPIPTHSKLQHYNRSRGLFSLKLCIIAAVSRDPKAMLITRVDVERALAWMLQAEAKMPDIFRAMLGRSDKDVIDEMHMFVMAVFSKDRKAVSGEIIRRFLLERVPHDKVESILQSAERANIIARVAGTQDDYVPRPKYGNGIE